MSDFGDSFDVEVAVAIAVASVDVRVMSQKVVDRYRQNYNMIVQDYLDKFTEKRQTPSIDRKAKEDIAKYLNKQQTSYFSKAKLYTLASK